MKKSLILSSILVSVFLVVHNIYAQESAVDYKQLIAKCSEAIKQAKSYNVKMKYKDSFTINAQENKSNSAELSVVFISPDSLGKILKSFLMFPCNMTGCIVNLMKNQAQELRI